MSQPGKLFVVSGPSGVGKGTICRLFCSNRPDVWMSVSCATRPPRPGEIEGVHYFFVTDEMFDRTIAQDGFLEYANVHGNRYGTPRAAVEQKLGEGMDVILEIDVQGASQAMARYPDIHGVFMLPPSREELLRRLIVRGSESAEQICRRLRNVPGELERGEGYPSLLLNENRAAAVRRLGDIIDGRFKSTPRERALLHDLQRQFEAEPVTPESVEALIEKYRRIPT
jgi:guanylate kinase